MATLTVSSSGYRAWLLTRSSTTATFTDGASLIAASPVSGTLPVGLSSGLLRKARSGVTFPNIDFSVMNTITSATLTCSYSDPSPDYQVNQSCTGARTVHVRRATSSIEGDAWTFSKNYTTTGAASISLIANQADGSSFTVDMSSIVSSWKSGTAQNGLILALSGDTTDAYTTGTAGSTAVPAAGFDPSDFTLTIEYTTVPVAPSAPQLVIQSNTTDGGTYGSTTAIKTFDASTTTQCNLRFSFIDDNESDGDYCQQYTIEVYTNSSFSGSPIWSEVKATTGSPTGTITYVLLFNNVPKDTDLYWRVKTADTNPGTYGPYSTLTNGSGSSQEIAKFRVQAATITPPPPGGGGGNPTYSGVTTFARNKFRVEFYEIQDTVTAGLEIDKADTNPTNIAPSFNPTPKKHADGNWQASAIIHDAKSIGVSQKVNGVGEFYLTLPSNHPQIGGIVPLRSFWRVCRWDETNAYFIVAGEGLVTEITSSPNEIIVHGIDKLGMLNRLIVPVDKTLLGAYYTFQNFRLDQIHDSLLPAAGNTETSISRSVTTRAVVADAVNGSVVTLTTSAAHTFVAGDTVTVTSVNDSELNGTFIVQTIPTSTTFTYRISNKSKNVSSGSAGTGATAVVARYTRHMFEPFQGTRKIFAGTTDVSSSPGSSSYRTVTETRSIMCDGKTYLETLSEFADILMAGTTDVVIVENPNVGLPADNPNNLNAGIQYRHLKSADIPSPNFWLKYGGSVSNFKYEPFSSKIASKAGVLNYAYDTSTTSGVSLFGVKSALNYPIYDNYGLIETFEKIDDERNDIQFAANLLYNRYPNQVLEFNLDVVSTQITPFGGYRVGDLVQIYIERRNVSVADKFSLVEQQWIGNEDGSEDISFYFTPQQRSAFKVSV